MTFPNAKSMDKLKVIFRFFHFNPTSRTLSNASRALGGGVFCPPLLDQDIGKVKFFQLSIRVKNRESMIIDMACKVNFWMPLFEKGRQGTTI